MLQPIFTSTLATLAPSPFGTTEIPNVILYLLASFGVVSLIKIFVAKSTQKENAQIEAPTTESTPATSDAVRKTSQTKQPSQAYGAATNETIPAHIAAIIAAAVHVALDGQKHRILHIAPASSSWAREGRRDILTSHRFR